MLSPLPLFESPMPNGEHKAGQSCTQAYRSGPLTPDHLAIAYEAGIPSHMHLGGKPVRIAINNNHLHSDASIYANSYLES
jgi:hypothetical protein